jgi:hypothetical protein
MMSKDGDEEDGVAIDVVIAAIAARGRTRGDHLRRGIGGE